MTHSRNFLTVGHEIERFLDVFWNFVGFSAKFEVMLKHDLDPLHPPVPTS